MYTLIFPNTASELLRVHTDDIIYVEADSNYCQMHLRGDISQDLWFNMKHFNDIVEEQMRNVKPVFIGVGRSLVINSHFIYRINPSKGELILYGQGCSSPVSLHASIAALTSLKKYVDTTAANR